MEWALAAPNSQSLDLIDSPWERTIFPGQTHPRQQLERLWEKISFTRLYYGQEFCERLLPKKEELAGAVMRSRERGLKFTLVTPYVSETGLGRLEELLAQLAGLSPQSEVVCNDWGVIYLIRKNFSSLVPVLGRLLNKATRDPRIVHYLGDIPEGRPSPHRYNSAANPHMKSLLKTLKVSRVEMDNLPQGMEGGLPDRGVPASLYIPYGFVSTGRLCFTGSWGLQPREKFMASGKSCSRLCRRYIMDMRDLSGCVGGGAVEGVFQKGNTVFYRQSGELLAGGLEAAGKLGVDRIVYQPDPL